MIASFKSKLICFNSIWIHFLFINLRISFKLIISSCIALSLAIYSPVLLMSQIRLVPGSTNQYQSKLTAFGASLQGHATLVFLSFLRIVLAIVILSILNIITTFRLKSHLKKKMISNVSLIKEGITQHSLSVIIL